MTAGGDDRSSADMQAKPPPKYTFGRSISFGTAVEVGRHLAFKLNVYTPLHACGWRLA